MATYKKRGAKKTRTSQHNPEVDRTEEVFSSLDTGASRIENWIANYQSQILGLANQSLRVVQSPIQPKTPLNMAIKATKTSSIPPIVVASLMPSTCHDYTK